jgi:hypothetical protein
MSQSVQPDQKLKQNVQAYADTILGLATFDLNGLPKEYYVTDQQGDIGWMQAIFQGLGLQALLASTLNLEEFEQLIIHTDGYRAVLVRQPTEFLAVLIPGSHAYDEQISDEWLQWLKGVNVAALTETERFNFV